MSSRGVWYGIAAVVIIAIAGYGLYAYFTAPTSTTTPPPPSGNGGGNVNTQNITLFGGEVSASVYGWGLTKSTLKSPGPTLNLTVGTPVHISMTVVGSIPHAFAIYSTNSVSSSVLFNSEIGTASNPLISGETKSVTFTPTEAGTFYYICPVPGHSDLGMWGEVKVTQ